MDARSLERYRTLRAKINNEIELIDTQIVEIDRQIHSLKVEILDLQTDKTQLEQILNGEEVSQPAEEEAADETPLATNMELLLEFIANNPGSHRRDLSEFFGDDLEENQVRNLISRASKNNLIENKGTKRESAWHIVES